MAGDRPLRLIVSGTREYDSKSLVCRALDRAMVRLPDRPIEAVMHGGAAGVDEIAELWARHRGWRTIVVPYNEGRKLDPHADSRWWGKLRNRLMIRRALHGVTADDVAWIAVWDRMSPGTAHGIALAAMAGVHLSIETLEGE